MFDDGRKMKISSLGKLGSSILKCYTARKFGFPATPINITVSLTNKCNSRCKTCGIWKHKVDDLSIEDWKKIIPSLGNPVWMTVTGGEPFLREDLVSLIKLISENNKPAILNLATNGILTDKIVSDVTEILRFYKNILIVNVSLDGLRGDYKSVRGVDAFDNVIETCKRLSKLKGLVLGTHIVASKYNIKEIPAIYDFAKGLGMQSVIVEIAGNRDELYNLGSDILPSEEDYHELVRFLTNKKIKKNGIPQLISFFRRRYYTYTSKLITRKRKIAPCYAGIASCYVNYKGDLLTCCVNSRKFGNLTENSFKELWFSKKAKKTRKEINSTNCFCTLANVYYTNRICNLR